MKEFGALVRERRERKGVRAYDLAYALGQAPSWLSRLEAGGLTHPPAPNVLNTISGELEVPIAELFEAMGYEVFAKPATSCAEASPTYDASDPRMRDFAARIAALQATKDVLWFLEANVPLLEKLAREANKEDS